ncbi:hypothetical protein BRARA_D01379 [Brassica rapa]|uniref:Myb/SANT-like domain-containing protein n=1 Tax=Brassica campestris TaxID=3711 RepID=A0A397ZS49_BRACM|nr:hypothetical protein BRARA_D01379 [Brassica rapa]
MKDLDAKKPTSITRIKFLKGQYQCYVDLLNNSSGFGWDPIMKRFVASNEVWNDYLKGHPNHKFLRYDSSEQFDDLKIIFDCYSIEKTKRGGASHINNHV